MITDNASISRTGQPPAPSVPRTDELRSGGNIQPMPDPYRHSRRAEDANKSPRRRKSRSA